MDVYTQFLNEYVYTPERKLWIDFTRLDGGRNLIDTGEFEYPNLATWSPTGDQTGNWVPTNAVEADEVGVVKVSTHSYKLTASAAGCYGAQNIGASGAHASTTLTLGVWTYSNAGNNANTQIGLTDTDGEDVSTGHKTAAWVFDTVSHTTDATPGQLYIKLIPGDTNNDEGIFDGVVLVEGSSLTPGWTDTECTTAPSGDQYKIGSYSMRIISQGDNGRSDYDHAWQASYAGLSFTLGAWMYADSGNTLNDLKLRIHDGADGTYSDACAEDDAWHWITVTHTADAAGDKIRCQVYISQGAGVDMDDVGYVDGIKLYVEGGITDAGGHPINIMGATPSGTDGWIVDGIDDYFWMTNAEMKRAGLDFTTEHPSIFVRGEFNAGAATQYMVSTISGAAKGYIFTVTSTEQISFKTYGGSDINTYSATGQVVGTEITTFSMSRDSVSSVNLYKGGSKITDTAGTHVDLTSSDQPFVVGAKAEDFTLPLNATLKCVLILNRPCGAVEQADIARMLEEICP